MNMTFMMMIMNGMGWMCHRSILKLSMLVVCSCSLIIAMISICRQRIRNRKKINEMLECAQSSGYNATMRGKMMWPIKFLYSR